MSFCFSPITNNHKHCTYACTTKWSNAGPFIKVQSVFMANQIGQNYSIGVKWAVQGHENRINNPPNKPL